MPSAAGELTFLSDGGSAVVPPGEARADLDIFLDYARRMDFRDRDGAPLIKWSDAESAFEAWKACSAGRPCDYTGLSYERLRGATGIQWPCTVDRPPGGRPLHAEIFRGTRTGGLGLLRDLHDLYLMAAECDISWSLVGQAAKGVRDDELTDVVVRCEAETATQMRWLRTRMKSAAPQALVVT